jgi:hypothetical protein
MAGFDIKSILDFNPPTYACPACRGLFRRVLQERRRDDKTDPWAFDQRCPVCRSLFVEDEWTQEKDAWRWLQKEGHSINHGKELMQHSRVLATLLREAEGKPGSEWTACKPWPTTRLLFEVLSRARHFVHFTTYGISHVMIGALKVTSMRVPVYGFASNVDANTRVELTEMTDEAPKLHAKVIPSSTAAQDAPHQKLIIVDGLLAFKGSANLTNTGLRKADRGLDISEVVTDYEQVTSLNNKYFAPVWKRITVGNRDEILMDGAPF